MISFKVKLFKIGSWTILRLPESASAKLPTRGQTMVEITINGFSFQTPLEPDGKGSHWVRVDTRLRDAIHVGGGTVSAGLTPIKGWPEPDVPGDLRQALAAAPQALTLWKQITPLARWEWIRWIHSTNSPQTRSRRIEIACSKLRSGKRRPCCWNRNMCTEPLVSKNGVLLEPKPLQMQK